MIFDLRGELDRLVTQVEQHPLTEVLSYEVQEPAGAEALHAVEQEFGKAIPRPVADLYGLLNGATFKWRFREDADPAHRGRIIEQFTPFTSVPENVFTLAGSIDFVPVEDALLDDDYTLPQIAEEEGEFIFDGVTYSDNEFCDMLRIFDTVSEGSAMAFVARPDAEAWKLMWLTDDWLVYDSSRVTWLEDYLRFTIATWGLISARDALFIKYKGHLQEPVVFDQNAASALVPRVLSAA